MSLDVFFKHFDYLFYFVCNYRVCERKRPARVGPDWSQMVRDQRMQNQLLQSEYNDGKSRYINNT